MTPLQFKAGHEDALLAAAREVFSLEQEVGKEVAINDATDSDGPSAGARVRKKRHRTKKAKATVLFAVAATLAALYAARRMIVPS